MARPGDPLTCLCFNVRAAARLITRRYDELLAPSGLLVTQFSMLSLIQGHGVCGVAELADWMMMDVSTATRNLRPLLSAGYAAMRPSRTDGRRKDVRVTAKGRRALAAAAPLWAQAQSEITGQLGDRAQHLLETLELLRPVQTELTRR